jgi:hypothetical protein
VLEKWDMWKLLEVAAKELEIDLKLIKGIVMIESSWRPNATRFEEHVYNRERKKWVPDEKAKLLSTSYWYFQIMWFNYKACGYESVEAFVEAMRDPRKQFEAFIKFVKSNTSLHIAMKNNDYTRIAYYYNWPKHAQNNYVWKLKKYV